MIIEMSKGYQISIPAKIRNELGWKPGTKLEVHREKKGAIIREIEAPTFAEIQAMTRHITQRYSVEEIKAMGRDR